MWGIGGLGERHRSCCLVECIDGSHGVETGLWVVVVALDGLY